MLNAQLRGWSERKQNQATVWVFEGRTFRTVVDAIKFNAAELRRRHNQAIEMLRTLKYARR